MCNKYLKLLNGKNEDLKLLLGRDLKSGDFNDRSKSKDETNTLNQEKGQTVSVSSVTVHANFAIGCFPYNGFLILSRAANYSAIKNINSDGNQVGNNQQESQKLQRRIELKKIRTKISYQEHFLEYSLTEEFYFAGSYPEKNNNK